MQKNRDLLVVLIIGMILISVTNFEGLKYLRWMIGIPFIFFLSGYPLTVALFPRQIEIKWFERVLMSAGFSILMTYPAAIIVAAIEGNSAKMIYGPHLMLGMCVLTGLTALTILIALIRRRKTQWFRMPSLDISIESILVGTILFVSTIMNFLSLGRADLNGDEYDIGYRSYYLVDGFVAGRNGYLLSFQDHTPLSSFLNHFSMQILNPNGFEGMSESIVRFGPAFIGVLCVLALYLLGREFFSRRIGFIAALIMAVSNYHIWTSRIFLREVFITFFVILAIYFLLKLIKSKENRYAYISGLFLGALLLSKIVAGFVGGVFLIFILLRSRKSWPQLIKIYAAAIAVFTPVIFYNVGAYITRGNLDIFFARIFGIYHPYGYTAEKSHSAGYTLLDSIRTMFELLIDQYSLWIFGVFIVATIYAILKLKKSEIKDAVTIQLIFLMVSLVFFSYSGVRAYYLPFLTIPFALFTGVMLEKLTLKRSIVLLALVSYSALFAFNTNISNTYAVADKWGDSGRNKGETLTIEPLDYHYSRSTRPWVESYGWQELADYVEALDNPTLILDLDNYMSSEMLVQYYLDIQHTVKQSYFEGEYEEKYTSMKLDEFLESPTDGYLITKHQIIPGISPVYTIQNASGVVRFNIYEITAEDAVLLDQLGS